MLANSSLVRARIQQILRNIIFRSPVVSDVVLAVGTNDLKREGMNPSVLARKMSRYVKIFVPNIKPCTFLYPECFPHFPITQI